MAIDLPSPATLTARWTQRKNAQKLSKQLFDDTRKSALFQVDKSARLIAENSSSVINALFEARLKGLPENVNTEFRMEFRAVEGLIRNQVRFIEALNHRYDNLSTRQRQLEEYRSIIKSYQAAFKNLELERAGLDQLIAKIDTRRKQLGRCARKVRLNAAENHLRDVGSLMFRLRHVADAKQLEECHDKLHRRQCQLQDRLCEEPAGTPGVYSYEQERSRHDIERLIKEAMRLKSLVAHRLRMLEEDSARQTVSLRK